MCIQIIFVRIIPNDFYRNQKWLKCVNKTLIFLMHNCVPTYYHPQIYVRTMGLDSVVTTSPNVLQLGS